MPKKLGPLEESLQSKLVAAAAAAFELSHEECMRIGFDLIYTAKNAKTTFFSPAPLKASLALGLSASEIADRVAQKWTCGNVSVSVAGNGYLNFEVVAPPGTEPVCESSEQPRLKGVDSAVVGEVVKATFLHKWGTPRQGGFVRGSRAVVRLCNRVFKDLFGADQKSPRQPISARGAGTREEDTISRGKEEEEVPLTDLVVVWGCHANDSDFNHLKTKVRPPKGEGRKVGVFSCRSPYRPSSIGLSVCRLEKIDKTCLEIEVSGADMLLHTPILSVSFFEETRHLPREDIECPDYLRKAAESPIDVFWGLGAFLDASRQFGMCQRDMDLAVHTLRQDPRSLHSVKKHVAGVYAVDLSIGEGRKVSVVYQCCSAAADGDQSVGEDGEKSQVYVRVLKVMPVAASNAQPRTKAWLQDLGRVLPAELLPQHCVLPAV